MSIITFLFCFPFSGLTRQLLHAIIEMFYGEELFVELYLKFIKKWLERRA